MDFELKTKLMEYATENGFYHTEANTNGWLLDDGHEYVENDNPDADNGDAWLNNGTSYIRRIGVLAVWDSNKCDYCSLIIGERRNDGNPVRVIGHLHFDEGENSDPAATVQRFYELMETLMHPVFWTKR